MYKFSRWIYLCGGSHHKALVWGISVPVSLPHSNPRPDVPLGSRPHSSYSRPRLSENLPRVSASPGAAQDYSYRVFETWLQDLPCDFSPTFLRITGGGGEGCFALFVKSDLINLAYCISEGIPKLGSIQIRIKLRSSQNTYQ